MTAREAWNACGQPKGEAGIQNIRKRARAVVAERAATTPSVTRATPDPVPEVVEDARASSGRKQPLFRLKPYQVQKREADRIKVRAEFDRIYAAATKEWQRLVATGGFGRGDSSAAAVAARFAQSLPEGCPHKISGRSLINAVAQGRAGLPKAKPGPTAAIPAAFVQSVAEFAQMKQVAGVDQKPRQLVQAAVASCKGTAFELLLSTQSQRADLLRRVRREWGLGVESSTVIDDRRWMWLTSTNLTT